MSEQYLGNPNLKKANQSISWTKDQILEFVRCILRDDILKSFLLMRDLSRSTCMSFKKN
jgi:hypothetical protein